MSVRTTTFEVAKSIQPIYNGGDVALDAGARILATCLDEEAILTDLSNGELLARIPGDGEALTALLMTPSASHIITCSRSLSMRIYALDWSEDSHRLEATLSRTVKLHSTPVVSATLDHTGTLLATGGADGAIKVWDLRGGYVSHTFRGHSGVISALHFFEVGHGQGPATNGSAKHKTGPTAYYLASGGEDSKIKVWDLAKRKAVASLESHVSIVRAFDYSPEKNILASGSRDRTLVLWDARTWETRAVLPLLEETEAIGFLRHGTYLYSGGSHGNVRLWNMSGGREITSQSSKGSEDNAIIQIVSRPQQNVLLSVHADQSLVLHSLEPFASKSDVTAESLPILRRIGGTHDEVIDLALVSRDQSLIALATNSECIRLVDITSSSEASGDSLPNRHFGSEMALLEGHGDIVICLAIDWSGCWLATGAKDNTARLWLINRETERYECHAIFSGHTESIGAIALPSADPPADSIPFTNPVEHPPPFMISGSQDKTIKKWTIPKPSAASDGLTQPQRATAAFTRKAHDKDINAIAIDPSSTLFASASQDRTVKIWSVDDGAALGVLRGHKRGVWSVAFAPPDLPTIASDAGPIRARNLVLTGSGDKTVRLWSLVDYACLHTFEGHSHNVLKVVWLPPSAPQPPAPAAAEDTEMEDDEPLEQSARTPPARRALLASAGADGLVRVWDAGPGECVSTLDNHTDRVWALAADAGSGRLVSGGGDGVVTFWADTSAATARASAAAASARVEQDQQLQNYTRRGDYRGAIVLALQLRHPARLLALFTDVSRRHPPEPGSISGVKAVDEVVAELDDEQLLELLRRLRDWNANAKTAPVAQRVLNVVARSYPAARLVGLRRKGKGVGEVVEALRVYTERHYRRCEELIEESYLVDFMVRGMSGI